MWPSFDLSQIVRQIGPISLFIYCALLCSFFLTFIPKAEALHLNDVALRNVFQHKDQCYNDSFVWVSERNSQKAETFSVISSTKVCADLLKNAALPEELENCEPGLADLSVSPIYVARSQISYPYANLNISITAHSSVETIAFRLECLSAADGSDVYCSDSKAMYFNNVKEWPCRALTVSDHVKYPVRFSYSCFRLTPFSVYAINATILPQKCRLSTMITAPAFTTLFPDALVDPVHPSDVKSEPLWAPTISTELSDESGIWIHLGKAKRAECDKMMVNVYREHSNDSSKVTFLETFEVQCPETAVKWENQMAGRYLLTAYVPIRGCKFICDAKNDTSCRQCHRTHLTLDIDHHRTSLSWRAGQTFLDNSREIFIALALLSLSCAIGGSSWFYCMKRKQKEEARRIQEIQLSLIVRPMLVYSDDTVEHRNIMAYLVDCLKSCANCEPVFDMEKLITPEPIVPSRWLLDQLSNLSKFVIVMSHCAVKLLDTELCKTHHLVTARPFADLFGPAMEIIMRDAMTNSANAQKKYCIVRLSYSPEVPANLALLDFPVFNLPAQFGELTAWLHNVEYDEANVEQNLPEERVTKLNEEIQLHTAFIEEHPGWLDMRFRLKVDPTYPMIRTTPQVYELDEDDDDDDDKAMKKASKKYGVDAPREDSDKEDDITPLPGDEREFMLYPPDHPDSDVENDDSTDDSEGGGEHNSDNDEDEIRDVEFRSDSLF